MSALAHLWSLPLGRLALAMVAVGAVGLTTRQWLPMLTVVAMSRTPTGPGPLPSPPPGGPRHPTPTGPQPSGPAQPANPSPSREV